MAEQFEVAMQQGLLRRENPQRAAMMLMDMLVSQDRMRMLFGGEAPDAAAEAQLIEDIVDFFFAGHAAVTHTQRARSAGVLAAVNGDIGARHKARHF